MTKVLLLVAIIVLSNKLLSALAALRAGACAIQELSAAKNWVPS